MRQFEGQYLHGVIMPLVKRRSHLGNDPYALPRAHQCEQRFKLLTLQPVRTALQPADA